VRRADALHFCAACNAPVAQRVRRAQNDDRSPSKTVADKTSSDQSPAQDIISAPGPRSQKVGLLPMKGWSRRNFNFVRRVMLPQLFSLRTNTPLRPDLLTHDTGEFQVTWIGHASFLIQTEGLNILVDPVWSRWLGILKRVRNPGLEIEDLPPIHAVLITHAHFDHLHLRALSRIGSGQPIVVPRGVGKLVRGRGFGEIIELDLWQKAQVGPLEITFTPSKHWGARIVHDVNRGFGGYLIRNESGRTVYHCGDSAYFEGFTRIGGEADIDLAMMPIGAYEAMSGRDVHLNPEEALGAFGDLKAKHMVPMHYGTFPLGGEPMDEPLKRLRAASAEQKLEKSVTVLTEGKPEKF
jgi:L-ascorbate metabolism protein UlaG (beta-lactamase superfamily)